MKHRAALHDKRGPWGVSAFDAQVALAELSARPQPPSSRIRLHGDALQGISRRRVAELSQSLGEAASLGAWTAGEDDDPWYGAHVTSADDAAQALEITIAGPRRPSRAATKSASENMSWVCRKSNSLGNAPVSGWRRR